MKQEIEQISAVYHLIVEFFITYSFQIIGAIIILLLGFWVANKVSNLVLGLTQRKNLDVTLSNFFANFVKIIIITMAAIIALGKLGISVTPFVAAIGAVSLGAGLAVQGLLSNYGAGLNIILTRPFVVGDTIEVRGVRGIVTEVHLAYTLLVDEDEVSIHIPNRFIVTDIIHNSKSSSLVELQVGISYGDDSENAIHSLTAALTDHPAILEHDKTQIGISEFADSSVVIAVRAYVDTAKLYASKYALNAFIYKHLKDNRFTIPFPQREVTMLNSK